MAVIDHVDWERLDLLVTQQQRNRSAHAPVISLFRWWARRPHSFAGALLDAARLEFGRQSFLVADPFSGGGTVAFEASRRRLPIYAQDLYSWPSVGLAAALTPADPNDFKTAAKKLLETLEPLRQQYWCRKDAERRETTHIIRVRKITCPSCSKWIYLFRDALVSLASRANDEQSAFFGCVRCGELTKRAKEAKSFSCAGCGVRSMAKAIREDRSTPYFSCPHCAEEHLVSALLLPPPQWRAVLIREQNLSTGRSVIRPVNPSDAAVNDAAASDPTLRTEIPNGLETGGLKRNGFAFWSELYTRRQLNIMTAALREVAQVDASEAVRQHLRLAVLGSAEMAGYVCRWERYNPKALEAIANHRFSRSTVTAETNLLSTSGRGTLPRRFEAAEKALRWMRSEGYPARTTHARAGSRRRNVSGALVVTGSSERQLLCNGAAQLIFTDPPYHDDLQYGELARLFHAWMTHAGECTESHESAEAVPNSVRGATTEHYEDKVAACLSESRRALAANGRLVLTFHNKNMKAWNALSRALFRARFDVVALAAVAAENAGDHSKRGKESFVCDLVIECSPKRKRQRGWDLEVQGATDTPERKNLEAIGLALAECVNRGEGDIEALFASHLRRLRTSQILIRRGGN
jgi:adenine-specific DNA methylase